MKSIKVSKVDGCVRWGRIPLWTTILLASAACERAPDVVGTEPPIGSAVEIAITWSGARDARMAYIPPYAESIALEMHRSDRPDVRYSLVANRPDDGAASETIRFRDLIPAGRYELVGVARTLLNGEGGTVASGATAFDVSPGELFTARLELVSTLTSLTVQGDPLGLPVGYRFPVSVSSTDTRGQAFVVPGSALEWRVVSGDDVVTIDAEGWITASAPGSAELEVVEVRAGVSGTGRVNVLPWPEPDLIWVSSILRPSHVGYVDAAAGFVYTELGRARYGGRGVRLYDIAWSPGPDAALYGCDDEGWLYRIDPTTAVMTRLGEMSAVMNSLAFSVDRRLFGAAEVDGSSTVGRLFEIDPQSGATRFIGFIAGAPGGDLDFSPHDGQLYVAAIIAGASTLLRVDPDTGSSSVVADLPRRCTGVAYTGRAFYAISGNDHVFSIDLESGAVVEVAEDISGRFYNAGGASAVLP